MCLKTIKSLVEKMTLEDKIVFFRFLVGLVYGVAVYLASLLIHPARLTPYAWSTSVMVYYATVIYVALKYKPTSRFQLYLRGLATFYTTWILATIIVFEIVRFLGVP